MAQEATTDDLFATIPIETMCGRDGAFQYRFGASDGPPMPTGMPGLANVTLTPRYAPFTRAAIDSTRWSKRIYRFSYDVVLRDRRAALAAIATLAARFEQAGWTREPPGADADGDENLMGHLPPGEGEAHLYSDPAAVGRSDGEGVRVELSALGEELSFVCVSIPLMEDQIGEVMGRLPPGTPRPVEPVIALPPGLGGTDCADPAARAKLAAFSPSDPDPLTRQVLARADYRERLVTWKMDRLRKSGKVSPERSFELLSAAFENPAAARGGLAGLELLDSMMADFQRLEAAARANDEQGQCVALVAMFGRLEGIGRAVDPQWTAIEAAIDAEAKRLGVSLE
jgi:hypothetical protein